MPEKDRESLSLFLESLIRLDTFGYTIFGDKPMSATGCWKTKDSGSFVFNKEMTYKKGQEIWEKYCSKLAINNFVFKFESTNEWYGIFLINKNAFLKVVERHLDKFRKILGKDITPESLYLEIVDVKNTIGQVVQDDECLLGILFGYGHKNAALYKKRQELLKNVSSSPTSTSISEYESVKKTLKESSSDMGILTLFPDVGFLADLDDEETKKILKHYTETKAEILNAFLSNDFLEAVLSKMAEKQSLVPSLPTKKSTTIAQSSQESAFEQQCSDNLREAEKFLSQLEKMPNIKTIIPNKLYNEVLHLDPAASSVDAPLFLYKITTSDKTEIANTYEEEPKTVSLTNTIIGFSKGVEGMKYGEKRRLYIHPDLAFRKIALVTSPQTLIIIDVEAAFANPQPY